MSTIGIIALAAGLYVIVGSAVALSMGNAISHAVDAIARQPEASGKISSSLMIGFVMLETIAIYGLLVSILMMFVLAGRV
ncbi:MAG: ATP F0F1 synthase subunit C [Oscillospiraceae bacterium]|jgi:F-type H+-transporting ATPase subunit c|nr:ATP F0F1 synthase subunit C [Oscillospiraceae bacterium]